MDIRHKIELLDILRNLAKEKETAIILSLHEIDLAAKISDQIISVKGDTIENCETPEEVFKYAKKRRKIILHGAEEHIGP